MFMDQSGATLASVESDYAFVRDVVVANFRVLPLCCTMGSFIDQQSVRLLSDQLSSSRPLLCLLLTTMCSYLSLSLG